MKTSGSTAVFHNLDEIPFTIVVNGFKFSGAITPSGHVLSDGIPSEFQVKVPNNPVLTISNENGIWVMPAPDDFVLELGVWLELYYQ